MSTTMELQNPEEMNVEAEEMEVRAFVICCGSNSAPFSSSESKEEEGGVQ